MNASKENAVKAQWAIGAHGHVMSEKEYDVVTGFLAAAKRKLPSEASFEREKHRKRKKPAATT